MLTLAAFEQSLRILTASNQFCLAFSGGLDSSVLLHLLVQLRIIHPALQLRAVHIHHGLSPNADDWQMVCQHRCSDYGVEFIAHRIRVAKRPQQSLEAVARTERYLAIKELLEPGEILLTAHHENDQAETLLLQLLRGCGPKGLAAMPAKMSLGQNELLRPLLSYSRAAIEAYAQSANLEWLDDESNQQDAFDRNFLRHEVLPLIARRWPAVSKNLSRAAQHCGNAMSFIDDYIRTIYPEIIDAKTNCLKISQLIALEPLTQTYLVRYWLQQRELPLPSMKKLHTLLQQLHSRHDAMPLITWQDVEVRRYDDLLYALHTLPPHDPQLVIPWLDCSELILPNDLGIVTQRLLQQHGVTPGEGDAITIRFRRGGERCYLRGRTHSHALKKLFQDWRVPPWLRDRIPLVYINDRLQAVIGYTIRAL